LGRLDFHHQRLETHLLPRSPRRKLPFRQGWGTKIAVEDHREMNWFVEARNLSFLDVLSLSADILRLFAKVPNFFSPVLRLFLEVVSSL